MAKRQISKFHDLNATQKKEVRDDLLEASNLAGDIERGVKK